MQMRETATNGGARSRGAPYLDDITDPQSIIFYRCQSCTLKERWSDMGEGAENATRSGGGRSANTRRR
jgi:hypothetical protein